jgi:hypothetical protein
VGHVEQLMEMRNQYTISDEIPDHFGDLEIFDLFMNFLSTLSVFQTT